MKQLSFAALLLTPIIVLAGCNSAPVKSDDYSGSISVAPSESEGTKKVSETSSLYSEETTKTTTTPNDSMTMSKDQQLAPPVKGDTIAIIETDLGTIKFRLLTKEVPEMSKNFSELASGGKFDGVKFHRVIKDFMIQTGDFEKQNGTGGYSYKGPGTKLNDEIVSNLHHDYGTVSMANAGANTNGSQFFIVTNKNGARYLDGNYSIFGQVFEGMDVAEQIQNLQKPGTDAPSKVVNMKTVKIEVVK